MVKVKICGVTNLQDALDAATLGADFVGFLVEIGFSQDKVSLEEAKEIISKLPLEITPVYVTYLQKAEPIIDVAKEIKPGVIQLHNDIDLKEIGKIRKTLKDIQITKTISVNEDALKEARKFAKYVDYILLDTAVKGKKGGTGKTHNWDISAKIVKTVKKKVFLAGGLNPSNVAGAVNKVKPFAVDVNSGVKKKARLKDYDKMKLFIERVK